MYLTGGPRLKMRTSNAAGQGTVDARALVPQTDIDYGAWSGRRGDPQQRGGRRADHWTVINGIFGTAGPRSGRPGRGGVGPFAWVPADLGYDNREASVWRAWPSASRGATTSGRMAARSGLAGKGGKLLVPRLHPWADGTSSWANDVYRRTRRTAASRRSSIPSGRQRQGDITPCHF